MATTLQADWLQSPLVKSVVAALGSDNVKFVGGAVRDTLAGRPVADIDAATRHLPEDTMSLLVEAELKAIPTGLKHGTVTAVKGAEAIEITTLRVDEETDGRHATVAFTDDWLEDAKRRDFTINALYADAAGVIFDPFNGVEDLELGTVRFIGNAVDRLEEDALRILRFFRFHLRYGNGAPNKGALSACTEKRNMLARLSIERVRDELLKMLTVASPLSAFELMEEAGILQQIFGMNHSLEPLKRFFEWEGACKVDPSPLLRLMYLGMPSMPARKVAGHFKLSNQEKRFLTSVEQLPGQSLSANPKEVRRAIYYNGADVVCAGAIGPDTNRFQQIQSVCQDWTIPLLPVQGRDLISVGVQPGPEMGKTLKELEARWIDSDFTLRKEELLAGLQGN